jgi:hypothetical protein
LTPPHSAAERRLICTIFERGFLGDEIRVCLRHAEECARKAQEERKPNSREKFLEMHRRWLRLAHSYQFAKQLKAFRKGISDRRKQTETRAASADCQPRCA